MPIISRYRSSTSWPTSIKGFTKPDAELTITIDRSDLDQVMVGARRLDELDAEGKARFEGDRRPFNKLRSILTVFTPDFEAGGKPAKLDSQPGTLEARLQELAGKGGRASRSLQAARIAVSEGRQPAAIQLIKEKKENEFLAKRAQSVTLSIVRSGEDVASIRRASQLLLSSALH
ncbi:alkyl sulfatase C-terminal domain-containing protein [Rhizobiaceae sp. 2RAB30]